MSLFNFPVRPLQKLDASWRMTVDRRRLNQVVASIAEIVAEGIWFARVD